MTLGAKVRMLRTKRGFTQQQLAAGGITRNMLSQIENDAAFPSLATLKHLAAQLQVPCGYLLSEDEALLPYVKQQFLPKLQRLYRAAAYKECLHLWKQNVGEVDDELALLLADCSLQCGISSFCSGSMKSALQYFEDAQTFVGQTIYPTAHLRASILLYTAICKNVQSPRLELDGDLYCSVLDTAASADLYHYVMEDHTHTYQNDFYAKHLVAKQAMRQGDYSSARIRLQELEESKAHPQMHAFLLFRIYSDMEICCRELQDFAGAYRFSTKRISLLQAFTG